MWALPACVPAFTLAAPRYLNTFGKLVPAAVTAAAGIPRSLDDLQVHSSAGFVMVNIGLSASREVLGLPKCVLTDTCCASCAIHVVTSMLLRGVLRAWLSCELWL